MFNIIALSEYSASAKLTVSAYSSDAVILCHVIIRDVVVIPKFIKVLIEVLEISVEFKYIVKSFFALLTNLF